MTALDYFANDTPVPDSTLTELFFEGVTRNPGAAACQRLETAERVVDISYAEVLRSVRRVAASLEAAGIERGDRVAILSDNRPEWAMADYGCLCGGIISVPIYPTLTAAQVAYVLSDSGAKLVFVSTEEQARKARDASAECPHEVAVVAFDAMATPLDGVIHWDEFLAAGAEIDARWSDETFRTAALRAKPDDVATVLYTSGTTGPPKGVMLTHNNVASDVRAVCMVLDVGATDNTVSFLPLSHILQRMADYLFMWVGCTIGYPRSMDTVVADMRTLRPTVVVSVPRVYEKIYNNVMSAQGIKRKLIAWAVGVADRAATLRLEGREPAGWLALQYRIADRLVFSKVKNAVGGNLNFFVSGGGPLAPALNRFFYSIGLKIFEGYGLTETSPVTHVNTESDFRIGTVGKPVPGTETRIAPDGEIFLRGGQVMKGYYNKPEATAEVIDAEGWFATGDIGEIDSDGFLKITDRKKDIIVTAGGKNVAPQPIENRLKTHELVEQAVLIGDRRRYCALLLVPSFPALEAWAASQDISWDSRRDLVNDARVLQHIEAEVGAMLVDVASFERPKKIALLDEEFTIENGLLTPTLKIKRREVQDRLSSVIAGLYEGEAADATGP
ncbi:MAG: long-chain fatty acid--CoA ligase [Gemmatimonadetes bacterium]|nr:long-chain fatty acid--CoA ligase [Gemmatimonadota bacterium]MDA1104169.1 long-chain fatty acid--CoA ligase [Gemmatimonadota bacterium]